MTLQFRRIKQTPDYSIIEVAGLTKWEPKGSGSPITDELRGGAEWFSLGTLTMDNDTFDKLQHIEVTENHKLTFYTSDNFSRDPYEKR